MNSKRLYLIPIKIKSLKYQTSEKSEKCLLKCKIFSTIEIKQSAVAPEVRQGLVCFYCGKKLHFTRHLAVFQRSQYNLIKIETNFLHINLDKYYLFYHTDLKQFKTHLKPSIT